VLRLYAAIWVAKATMAVLRLLRSNGTHLPGRIAMKMCPTLIAQIAKPARIVAVTGTNGKTTTSNLLAQALTGEGYKVLNNGLGSNTDAGVAAALIDGVTWRGRATRELAVFEVDERSSYRTLPGLKPQFLVCTNLTRDSIQRNAHAEYIAWILSSSIPPETTLIVNADDLICATVGRASNKRVLFGVGPMPTDGKVPQGSAIDLSACPQCGVPLLWDYWRYNHIGHAHCPACGFESPKPDYCVTAIDAAAGQVSIDATGRSITCHLLNDNIVNVYNQVAVAAVLDCLGVPLDRIAACFDHLTPPTSRYLISQVGGVTLVRHMVKGAVGVAGSRTFQYVMSMPGNKVIVMDVDDAHDVVNDCQNNSWLYDTDYEYLADPSLKQIVVGGVRCYDHALRLVMAGVDPSIIVTTTDERHAGKLVDLTGIDTVINLHSLYNYATTGNAVQAELIARLEGARP